MNEHPALQRARELLAQADDALNECGSAGFDYDAWAARMPPASDSRALQQWADELPNVDATPAQRATPVMFRTNPNARASAAPAPAKAPPLSKEAVQAIAEAPASERKAMRDFVRAEVAPLRAELDRLRQELEQLQDAARAVCLTPRLSRDGQESSVMSTALPTEHDPSMALARSLFALVTRSDEAGLPPSEVAYAILAQLRAVAQHLNGAPRIILAVDLAELAKQLDPDLPGVVRQ